MFEGPLFQRCPALNHELISVLVLHRDKVDYSKLCPFCDEPLPPRPSTTFNQLFSVAKARARPEPRAWNPYGLRATLLEYSTVCRQHDIDSEVLPQGLEEGWPYAVDWHIFEGRVMDRQELLEPIVSGVQGARENSFFWDALQQKIKTNGSRKALDSKYQAQAFGGNQAG